MQNIWLIFALCDVFKINFRKIGYWNGCDHDLYQLRQKTLKKEKATDTNKHLEK